MPEKNHKMESMKEGVVMFCSFALFGVLPLLGYVIIPALFPALGEEVLFASACVVTGLVLFGMGCVKSVFRYVCPRGSFDRCGRASLSVIHLAFRPSSAAH